MHLKPVIFIMYVVESKEYYTIGKCMHYLHGFTLFVYGYGFFLERKQCDRG
jgi:hypothetical protein